MEVRAGYKQTEVGIIPSDWNCASVAQIASNAKNSIVGGPFGSDLVTSDYVSSGVPVVRGQNMGGGYVSGDFVFVSKSKAKNLQANTARAGDLVFTQRGTLGQVSIVPIEPFGEYVISQSQMKLTLNPEVADTQYVYQYFSCADGQKQIIESAIQTGVPHTNLGILKAYRIPLPPSPTEQRAIAAALSDVDALLGGMERLIAKKRELKQAAMQQLLTGQTRLPGFSGEWEVKRLGELAEMGSGGTPLSSVTAYYDGDIPWVSISDMTSGGKVIESTERNLTALGFAKSAAQMFPPGTVLYAMYASLGECSIAGQPLCTSQAILGIRPKINLSAEFLYYYLMSLKPIIKTLGQQGTQSNLNKGMVQNFRLSLPPLPEQTAIAAVLSDMDAELSALTARRDKTCTLKQAMMQELLTGKTRLVEPVSNVIPVDFPAKPKPAVGQPPAAGMHNWAINEAVVVAVLVKQFGSEQYPLGRKRCTKLSYLLHRHVEHVAQGYLKKAAGPYNPAVKYKGPEGIAQKNGYIRAHTQGKFAGFVAAEKVAQAEGYFAKWYGLDVLAWLEQFRFKSNDELELLATVDMAVEDLRHAGRPADVDAVKSVIRSHPEWEAKLEREIFSDANLVRGIAQTRELFQ